MQRAAIKMNYSLDPEATPGKYVRTRSVRDCCDVACPRF